MISLNRKFETRTALCEEYDSVFYTILISRDKDTNCINRIMFKEKKMMVPKIKYYCSNNYYEVYFNSTDVYDIEKIDTLKEELDYEKKLIVFMKEFLKA